MLVQLVEMFHEFFKAEPKLTPRAMNTTFMFGK